MKKNLKYNLFFFFLLLFLLGASFVFALEIDYPRIPGALPPQDFLKTAPQEDILSLYVKYFFNLVLWLAGIIAFGALIYGGLRYLTSTGKPEAMVSAKDQIISAFFGLLILLSSFLILKTLSPQFISFKIPTLKTVQFPQKPVIPAPEITAINTSIEIEMPFGRVIEKIFETYIADYPEPDPPPTPRIERIKNIARAIIAEEKKRQQNPGIADKLKKQSEELKDYSDDCACSQTRPCCRISNPGPGCRDNACRSKLGTTSDPCKKIRGDIQNTEDKNKTEINNLAAENIKIEEEIQSLKEWLDHLKRAEKFIKECPWRNLSSLAQIYSKKDTFEKKKWTLRETKFWDDISIVYNKLLSRNIFTGYETKKPTNDFASFYCAVSGTIEQQPSYTPPNLTGEEAEETLSEAMACSSEAPVGEISDRTKRTTQLLIDKLEELLGKNKELIDAVDKLQVLVSQCSSQRCYSYCHTTSEGDCIKRADDASQYPEGPCPKSDIKKQLEEIQKIWGEMKDIIEGKDNKDTPDNVGIVTIIDEIVPPILEDLEWQVRKPMKDCSSKNWLEQDRVLFRTSQAIGATTPEGRVIRLSCQTESWNYDIGKIEQTVYGDCFEECYLEKEIEKNRECVQKCLDGLSVMSGDPEIAKCTSELNFYCCHVK